MVRTLKDNDIIAACTINVIFNTGSFLSPGRFFNRYSILSVTSKNLAPGGNEYYLPFINTDSTIYLFSIIYIT